MSANSAKRVFPVYIDARMVGPVPHGISRYVTRLASGLSGLGKLPYEPVFLVSSADLKSVFSGFEIEVTQSRFLAPGEMSEIPRILREKGAALYHSPSFSSLPVFGKWRASCPWVQTVHDLNHLHYGDLSKKLYYRFLLKPFARRAAALATVSEFSRKELAAWLGISSDRIEIVSNALEPSLLESPPESEALAILQKLDLKKGKYFFCLSNSKPHKNIALLVRAYTEYRKRFGVGDPWPLAISMGDYAAVTGVRALGGLKDREVEVLRANAAGVLFPSLYEGFGLPPVEAAIAGVPVAVSRIPPHEEGLMDLDTLEAIWVEPRDSEGWIEAFKMIRNGQISPVSLQGRQKILHRFNEREMAQRMDRIYRRVLDL